jgi:hypothetical protein
MAGFAYSVEVTDTRGLDPAVYRCVVGFVRRDGEPLTATEVDAIKAALASEASAVAAVSPPAESGSTAEAEAPKATGTGGE